MNREEMKAWMRSSWHDIRGESTRKGHPAPYPVELAERLIKMFSFAGDTVLDPFCGTGTTAVAAIDSVRNSISVEIEPKYFEMAKDRLREATWLPRTMGSTRTKILFE